MRERGREVFHRPLNFSFDVAGTILLQLHTRLCCVHETYQVLVRNLAPVSFVLMADVLLLL